MTGLEIKWFASLILKKHQSIGGEKVFFSAVHPQAYERWNKCSDLKKVCEASYFFKMSKYQKQLVAHIENNPSCIQPETQRKFILTRLKDDLRDLSISRTTFKWGIPVPSGFEEGHVMYVWFDALTNYLTGVNGLEANEDGSDPALPANWPADCHLIGKDIVWFHCVIWPCMLMSASIPLPKTVFAHGFVNDSSGKKMSKSIGNTIDPHDMLDKYSVDTFRWYLAKECPFGGELSFSEESLATMHNADLCDTLGNLVHRATNLCQKYCGGAIPDVGVAGELPVDLEGLREKAKAKMSTFNIDAVASLGEEGGGGKSWGAKGGGEGTRESTY
jgi:methionyl-tRNA synthetase